MHKKSMFSLLFFLVGCGQSSSQGSLWDTFQLKDEQGHPSAQCDSDCQDLRQEFRYAVWLGEKVYCYWSEKKAETGIDYKTFAKSLEQEIKTGTTLNEYFPILRRWAASLHDGHVGVRASGEQRNKLEIYSSDVRLGVVYPGKSNETVFVSMGEGTGSIVKMINGQSVKAALDEGEKQVFGSTVGKRRIKALTIAMDALGSARGSQPLILGVEKNGTTSTIQASRTLYLADLVPAHESSAEETGAAFVQARVLPEGIGYLKIDEFSGKNLRDLLEGAMERLRDTKGLIIDVRENGGGDMSGNVVLSRLVKEQVFRYEVSPRVSDLLVQQRPEWFEAHRETPSSEFTTWRGYSTIKPHEKPYGEKPVILLTGRDCFSACDTFTAAFRAQGLGTVIGTPTGGGTGAPMSFELPFTEFGVRYSVMRGRTTLGAVIEGAGTTPDVIIEPSVEQALSGEDPQMAEAVRLMKSKLDGDKVGQAEEARLIAQQLRREYLARELRHAAAMPVTAREWQRDDRLHPVDEQPEW